MNGRIPRAVAAALGIGLLLLIAAYGFINSLRSPDINVLLQCSQNNSQLSLVPAVFPVAYETERTISPTGLREPTGLRLLSSAGASTQVVLLTYETRYLQVIRTQRTVGVSFHGIAPLDPLSVPAGVKARYSPDAEYVIAPNSCLPT